MSFSIVMDRHEAIMKLVNLVNSTWGRSGLLSHDFSLRSLVSLLLSEPSIRSDSWQNENHRNTMYPKRELTGLISVVTVVHLKQIEF